MKGTILAGDWLIVSALEKPKKGWGIRICGEEITATGPASALRAQYPEDDFQAHEGTVIAPGFVNTHQHLYGTLAHGIPQDKAPADFWGFLQDYWWPLIEDSLDQRMIAAATDFGICDMLRGGTTTFYDCLEGPHAIPGALRAQKEVVDKRGMRGILSFEATERVSRENGRLGLLENTDFIDLCQKEKGLVGGMMCFHTTFTCSAEFIRQAFFLAAERHALTHLHCSEGTYEPEFCQKSFGKRPLFYYDELQVQGPGMLASQCVHITPAEIDLAARRGVRVSHMPLSNCEVGGGIAPVPQLLDAGVPVGLGSDGYINDFFEVMRGAFLIHKAHQQNPQVMPAHTVWYLATEGGARALGLERVGRLTPGWKADVQVIDADLPTPLAEHNLYDQLLLWRNQRHVRHVWVNGRQLVRGGEVLGADLAAIRAMVEENAQRLWERA
jgi:5-methylthioadenosine/S-adenosylhomocysteine deaminase